MVSRVTCTVFVGCLFFALYTTYLHVPLYPRDILAKTTYRMYPGIYYCNRTLPSKRQKERRRERQRKPSKLRPCWKQLEPRCASPRNAQTRPPQAWRARHAMARSLWMKRGVCMRSELRLPSWDATRARGRRRTGPERRSTKGSGRRCRDKRRTKNSLACRYPAP